jgi:cellulose synthase/poly-beta-1,6-N-acetylglucosamine synthase-like glycosyltransferase
VFALNALTLTGLIGVILLFLPSTVFLLTYSILGFQSKKYKEKRGLKQYSGELVSIIIPVRREPVEYIERALAKLAELRNLINIEVIIVSDDPPEFLGELRSLVDKWRGVLRVNYIWRMEPRGFRAGALNTGLFASIGDYVYVMDVDSFFDPCLITEGVSLLKSEERLAAVVGRWSVWNTGSRLSDAIGVNMNYVVNVLFKARSALGLNVFPLGTGTIYKASVLRDVLKGWDENRIQDDMDLGVRLHHKGFSVEYLDSCRVYVEAPTRYSSLKLQQERWAYGATDVVLTRLRLILESPLSLASKLESILFLSQYITILLMWIGFALTVVASLLAGVDFASRYLYMLLAWLVAEAVFGLAEAKMLKGDYKFIAVNQGRIAAVTTALSTPVVKGVVKALLRVKLEYKRTPKGFFEKSFIGRGLSGEIVHTALLAAALTLILPRRYTVLALVTSMYLAGLVYTLIRWPKDILGLG